MKSVDYQKPSEKLHRATDLAFYSAFFFLPISKPALFVSLALAFSLFFASGGFAAAWRSQRMQPWMVPAAILGALPVLSLALHKNLPQGIANLNLAYYWLFAVLTFFVASRHDIL